MKVEIYADVVCPWCYIGDKRFEGALAEYGDREDVEVVYRSFQLDPGAPESAIPVSEYREKRFGSGSGKMMEHVTEAASGEGITIDWDCALTANTLTAHRLLRLAREEYGPDAQRSLMERLFAAHFSHGGNVADQDELTKQAFAVGMDEERVREYLESGEGLDEVRAELDHARQLGIQSVPTFVFDGQYAVQGGQPKATFLQVLEEVRQRSGTTAGLSAPDDG